MKWSKDEERVLETFGEFVAAARAGKAATTNTEEVLDRMTAAFKSRLERGAMMYGPLDLGTDDRDFVKEAGDESCDKVAYLIFCYLENPEKRMSLGAGIAMTLAVWAGLLDGRSNEE